MASLTVRNIPDAILEKLKALSSLDRRSLNNEVLIILERGTGEEVRERMRNAKRLSKVTQLEIWKNLLGTWEDARSAREIIDDIRNHRTIGRDVRL
jgi:plasmid stability protein